MGVQESEIYIYNNLELVSGSFNHVNHGEEVRRLNSEF